jgi:hypothetical protein
VIRRLVTIVLAAATAAAAQDAPNVTGRVTSLGDIPVGGIEVRIDGTKLVTRTDNRGAFAFSHAPAGSQEIVARGIGYLPSRKVVLVPENSVDVAIVVLPAPTFLDTVKIRERINVLSGVVVDEFDKPVPDATVSVITGDKQELTSGPDGFFTLTSVREGTVVFRTTKDGYYSTVTAVHMNEWRGVVIHIESLDAKLSRTRRLDATGTSNTAMQAWRDARQRMSNHGAMAVVVGEEDLAPYADMPLGRAIVRTAGGGLLVHQLLDNPNSVCVLQDGRRALGRATLDSWQAGEVEMVELYPPGQEATGTLAQYARAAGCGRNVFYAVLWMK